MITLLSMFEFPCVLALINLLQELAVENPATTAFDDLGKLLLGGMVVAIVVAVGFTFVRFKRQDKHPPASRFISINSPQENQGE
jgi:hypothetical protein